MVLRVDVQTNRTADTSRWAENHAAGRVPDAFPYGLDHLLEHGYAVAHRVPVTGRAAPLGARLLRGIGNRWDWYEGAAPSSADIELCWDERSGIPTALLHRPRSVPVVTGVIWITDADQRPAGPYGRLARAALERCAAVWTLSEPQLPVLREQFGVPAERCFRLPFGIDAEFWSPAAESAGSGQAEVGPGIQIVGVGNDRHRDHRQLVAAVAPLAVAGTARLHLVTELPVTVPAAIGRSTTRLDHRGLRAAYAAADVVAVCLRPNLHVSGMTTVLEAQAMGRPVVCTRTPGMTDYVVDGVTAVLVEPDDTAGMTAALRELAADPARRAEMGRAGREFVLSSATTATQAAHLARILDDVRG